MALRVLLLLGTVIGPASHAPAAKREDSVTRPRLYWRNGDTLDGRFLRATPAELDWETEWFDDAVRLRTDVLHMIRFPTALEPQITQGDDRSQVIETRQGNRFFGRVIDSSNDAIELDTSLFGTIQLKRDAVSLIVNPVERAHVYSGPQGLRGWSTLTYGRKLEEWEEIASGRLHTKMVAAELYRPLPANGSIDIDVEFLWRNNPSFQLRFLTPYAKPTKETVKFETRVGGYVIQTLGSNGRFRQLATVPKTSKKCRLRLRWNHSAAELSVFRGRQYLGKISVQPQNQGGTAGIYIKNTGPQLTLSRLEIQASSTLDIALTDPARDTVLTADNRSLVGRVSDLDEVGISLEQGVQIERFAWSEVAEISFGASEGQPLRVSSEAVECVFQNGETLKGELLGGDAASLSLRVPAIRDPIRCSLEGMERVVLSTKTAPLKHQGSFVSLGEVKLHGRPAPSSLAEIGWLPVGAVAAVGFRSSVPATLQLTEANTATAGGPQDDLIYFNNRDVLPCRLHVADAERVDLTARFSGKTTLHASTIRAVELAAEPIAPVTGFDDRWSSSDPALTDVTQEAIRFTGPAKVQRQSVINGCDRIGFVMQRNSGAGGVFVHFRLEGHGTEPAVIPFYFMDRKLYVMGAKRNAFIPSTGDEPFTSVVVETHDPFRVEVNGQTIYSIPGSANGGPWSSLSVEVNDGPLFGHPLRTRKNDIDIEIRQLELSQTKRHTIRQAALAVNSDTLLTVPRNRRPDDITHVAVGTNGDTVRGSLVELTENRLHLRSKSKDVILPRQSVSGLVSISDGHPVDSSPNTETRVILRDTSTLSLSDARLSRDAVVGQHPYLGPCKVPLVEVQSILIGEARSRFHRHSFLSWQKKMAPAPQFEAAGAGRYQVDSALIGQPFVVDAYLLDSAKSFELDRYQGKVVVLDLWTTWCAPCMKGMPQLISVVSEFGDAVQLIALNQGEDATTVRTLLRTKQWPLLVAMDDSSSAQRALGNSAVPQTVVIDQAGNVSAVYIGTGDGFLSELRSEIQRLLGE